MPINQRRRRIARRLIMTAPAVLLAGTLAGPALAAGPPAAVSSHAARANPASQQTASVTLPTGDTVNLSAAGAGRYTVTPGRGEHVPFAVASGGRAGSGTSVIDAIPITAAGLVTDGALDRNMFDVRWLASHQADGLKFVLQYGGHPAAGWLASRGAGFPGARVLATSPSSETVTVGVPAARARAFWAALTGQQGTWRPQSSSGAQEPALTGGATHAWLAGHRSTTVRGSATNYTVTVNITKPGGIALKFPQLIGVTGADAGFSLTPASRACVDSACTSWHVIFQAPAGVYEFDDPSAMFQVGDETQFLDVADPQLTVAGNTSATIDASKARKVTISTPLPNSPYTAGFADFRTMPDGKFFGNTTLSVTYGFNGLWAVPTTRPVTIGSYRYETDWTMGAPPVTMTVQGDHGFALDPLYPDYSAYDYSLVPLFKRFSGHHVLSLVYAREGTAADFKALNARGKLVLLDLKTASGCAIADWQLSNAQRAGATGVIFGTRDPGQSVGFCSHAGIGAAPNEYGAVPYASIDMTEAPKLQALLKSGTVKVAVDDSGATPYTYDLKFVSENKVPASLHYNVSSGQLAQVSARYEAPVPQVMSLSSFGWRAGIYSITAASYNFRAPFSEQEYYGPVSPAELWQLQLHRAVPGAGIEENAFDVFSAAKSANTWYGSPATPGAAVIPRNANGVVPGMALDYCSMCRQGNFLAPFMTLVNGEGPGVHRLVTLQDSVSVSLYNASGKQIPVTAVHGISGFTLPAGQARYKLVTTYDQAKTTWQFASKQPTKTSAPGLEPCAGTILKWSTAACGATPLIFLDYDGFTSLSGSVTAPGSHQLQVTPYYQAVTAPAKVTDLKLWTSVDGGKTWKLATLHRNTNGSYTASYAVPAASATDGFVSIKTQATDSAGDSVSQVVTDAIALSSGK